MTAFGAGSAEAQGEPRFPNKMIAAVSAATLDTFVQNDATRVLAEEETGPTNSSPCLCFRHSWPYPKLVDCAKIVPGHHRHLCDAIELKHSNCGGSSIIDGVVQRPIALS